MSRKGRWQGSWGYFCEEKPSVFKPEDGALCDIDHLLLPDCALPAVDTDLLERLSVLQDAQLAAARADYAETIAVVALDPAHQGQVHELAGDQAYRMVDMAAEVSRLTGKAIGYASLPEADYAGMLMGHGLPEGFARMLADGDAKAAKGALFDDSRTLSRLIGRPTTPIAETAKAALA